MAACAAAKPAGASGTTIRSRSPGFSVGRRRLAKTSVAAETSSALALLMAQPLSEQDADRDERRGRQEPGHEPFRHRPEMADRPAAAVVRVLRPLDVADNRVHLLR